MSVVQEDGDLSLSSEQSIKFCPVGLKQPAGKIVHIECIRLQTLSLQFHLEIWGFWFEIEKNQPHSVQRAECIKPIQISLPDSAWQHYVRLVGEQSVGTCLAESCN